MRLNLSATIRLVVQSPECEPVGAVAAAGRYHTPVSGEVKPMIVEPKANFLGRQIVS